VHISVVRALSQKWKGMTRAEIVTATKINAGGGLSDFDMNILFEP
jgi:hypothetical protein